MSNKFNVYVKALILVASIALLSGCAPSIMVPTQRNLEMPQGQAIVTFIRATSFGGAIDFGIWDSDKLVGVLRPQAYIEYAADPGEHLFLARAENWSYVKANLEAGKRYYILANVSLGVWKARVVLAPITKNQDGYNQQNITEWMTKLNPTTPDPTKGAEYRQPRIKDVQEAVNEVRTKKAEYKELGPSDNWQ